MAPPSGDFIKNEALHQAHLSCISQSFVYSRLLIHQTPTSPAPNASAMLPLYFVAVVAAVVMGIELQPNITFNQAMGLLATMPPCGVGAVPVPLERMLMSLSRIVCSRIFSNPTVHCKI